MIIFTDPIAIHNVDLYKPLSHLYNDHYNFIQGSDDIDLLIDT